MFPGFWPLKSSGIFQWNKGYQKAICCSELIFLSLALLHWLPDPVFPWGCNLREGCPWARGAEEPLHSRAQRHSSTMVLIQPVLPFLAHEKGAVGAGDGPGPAGSLLLLRLLKHQALPLKLGQLLSFLLQGEPLAENAGLRQALRDRRPDPGDVQALEGFPVTQD